MALAKYFEDNEELRLERMENVYYESDDVFDDVYDGRRVQMPRIPSGKYERNLHSTIRL